MKNRTLNNREIEVKVLKSCGECGEETAEKLKKCCKCDKKMCGNCVVGFPNERIFCQECHRGKFE